MGALGWNVGRKAGASFDRPLAPMHSTRYTWSAEAPRERGMPVSLRPKNPATVTNAVGVPFHSQRLF